MMDVNDTENCEVSMSEGILVDLGEDEEITTTYTVPFSMESEEENKEDDDPFGIFKLDPVLVPPMSTNNHFSTTELLDFEEEESPMNITPEPPLEFQDDVNIIQQEEEEEEEENGNEKMQIGTHLETNTKMNDLSFNFLTTGFDNCSNKDEELKTRSSKDPFNLSYHNVIEGENQEKEVIIVEKGKAVYAQRKSFENREGILIDFSDELSVPYPSPLKRKAEVDDTFGIFAMKKMEILNEDKPESTIVEKIHYHQEVPNSIQNSETNTELETDDENKDKIKCSNLQQEESPEWDQKLANTTFGIKRNSISGSVTSSESTLTSGFEDYSNEIDLDIEKVGVNDTQRDNLDEDLLNIDELSTFSLSDDENDEIDGRKKYDEYVKSLGINTNIFDIHEEESKENQEIDYNELYNKYIQELSPRPGFNKTLDLTRTGSETRIPSTQNDEKMCIEDGGGDSLFTKFKNDNSFGSNDNQVKTFDVQSTKLSQIRQCGDGIKIPLIKPKISKSSETGLNIRKVGPLKAMAAMPKNMMMHNSQQQKDNLSARLAENQTSNNNNFISPIAASSPKPKSMSAITNFITTPPRNLKNVKSSGYGRTLVTKESPNRSFSSFNSKLDKSVDQGKNTTVTQQPKDTSLIRKRGTSFSGGDKPRALGSFLPKPRKTVLVQNQKATGNRNNLNTTFEMDN